MVTQNIDNLHQASGIAPRDVVELHGNTTYATCLACDQRYEVPWVKEQFDAQGECAPDCSCGGFIKTATVSFGQSMPADEMRRAEELSKTCDLFLVVGSSLVVWPAAGFPLMAKRNGAKLVIVNRDANRVRRHRRSGGARRYRRRLRTLHFRLIRKGFGCVQSCAQAHFALCGFRPGVIFNQQIRRSALQEALDTRRSGVMAADGVESKMPGTTLRPGAVRDLIDDTATDLIELSGVIKWFDVSKGFGFIIPDNGMPDILLHVTCLRRDGYQTAYEGARVVVEVQNRQKGLQAFRVVSMDESTAIHPAEMLPPRTHVTVTPTSGLERAQVKWFNRLRGFGFLSRGEGTPDIFVHMETLRRFGLAELRPGQTVLVRFGPGPKGLMAAEVRPDGGSIGLASH